MVDGLGRNIDYLRISVTDRCNYRCVYCMPPEGVPSLSHSEILTYDEIIRVAGIMADLGIKKIKITGGEPLLRKNVDYLIKALKSIEGVEELSLTTNGFLLEEKLPNLIDAGVDAVNVSLDTLDEKRYAKLSRGGELSAVLSGIQALISSPIKVKINAVAMTESKVDVLALAEYAKNQKIDLRFIELMPIGLAKNLDFLSEAEIMKLLEKAYGKPKPSQTKHGNGPAHYYDFPGFCSGIGMIAAMSNCFCAECNRLRLSADGDLKLCLQHKEGISLKKMLRSGFGNDDIRKEILRAVTYKPTAHNFSEKGEEQAQEKGMSQIGG